MERQPFSSLYVHVPFCHGKCDYCAFYSLGRYERTLCEEYLRQMERHLAAGAGQCLPLRSVFIGGGTPTALDDDLFQRLLEAVKRHFRFLPDGEWTVEANPESLSEKKIRIMTSLGVTRVSMGIQSFNLETRKVLGRRGSLQELPDKVQKLREAGIRHLNMDFIFNVPGQTPEDFERDLRRALDLRPDHLSAYALTIEEGTALAQKHILPDDEDFLRFWQLCDDVLGEAGLKRYEISNFAREDSRCRHNHDIWHGGTYLGVGPAATSFDGLDRWTQPADIQAWLQDMPPEIDKLSAEERAAEVLAFGMRTVAGWTWNGFRKCTGFEARELRGDALKRLAVQGLLEVDDAGARPTGQGLLFNDNVVMELLL